MQAKAEYVLETEHYFFKYQLYFYYTGKGKQKLFFENQVVWKLGVKLQCLPDERETTSGSSYQEI